MQPEVTIIVPTYNYGHLIGETLDCLINQVFKDWEAIIIDDGSTDETEKVVLKYTAIDSRIKYSKQENKGVSVARNLGLKLAKGNFIQFLDADDLISPQKINLQLTALKETKADICLVNTKYFDTDNPKKLYSNLERSMVSTPNVLNGSGYEMLLAFVQKNQTVIQSPLARNAIFKENLFPVEMAYLEDWDFWFRCALNNCTFCYFDHPEATAFVRMHPKSATQQQNRIIESEAKLRANIDYYLTQSSHNLEQINALKKLNDSLLINTFKYLIAKTPLYHIKKIASYYQSISKKSIFYAAFFKAINLKRKRR